MRLILSLGAAVLAMDTNIAAAQMDLKFEPGADSRFNWTSYDALKRMDLSGTRISVFGPWLGEEKALAESVFAYFEAATGAKVDYAGSDSLEQQIVIDTQAGSAPNITAFPQPGLAANLAAKGFLTPLGDATRDWVEENYAAGQSWVDLGTYANPQGRREFYGFFYKIDVKSLVWYVPENFKDAGYQVPTTLEELKALTQQIAEDGQTPWCIGLGSGGATGWPATDWVEDLMLRMHPPPVYDGWVSNDIPFDHPAVVAAIEEFGYFARNDAFVDGGTAAVASTDFRESPKGLFTSPPRCYMHRQASFAPTFFPADIEVGVDADFFYFPSFESTNLGKPVLGSGNVFAITKDSEGARAFIEFLKSPIAHEIWMAQGGFLTPLKDANSDVYANETLRKQGDILSSATTFRFDASDLMPGRIGAGAFWTGMIDFVGGKSAQSVAADIQATWEASK